MKNLLIILFTTIFLITAYSQDSSSLTKAAESHQPTINIEFTEPKIFRVKDQIYIDVKILNKDDKPYSSLIAQDKRYSFDFELLSLQNRKLQHSTDYNNFFNRVQPIFNSMIRLEKNEGFTYRILLNDYYDMNLAGQYLIRCLYYPSLKVNYSSENTVKSNYITLNIKPASIHDRYIEEKMEVEKEKQLFAEKKSPDEVVEYMLRARMNSEWEKFFLYMDLNQLILTNSTFKARYQKADSEKQLSILEEYKQYLKRNTINEISYLPHEFKIMKTEYSEGNAKVEVIIKFKELDYIDEKYYTYFLKKRDNKWFITNYTVFNLTSK